MARGTAIMVMAGICGAVAVEIIAMAGVRGTVAVEALVMDTVTRATWRIAAIGRQWHRKLVSDASLIDLAEIPC